MTRMYLASFWLWALAPALVIADTEVQTSTASPEATSRPEDETTSMEESEAKDVIPPNAEVLFSSRTITPTSVFPEKMPYDQARDELIRALELWNAGHAEAASDKALEAFDDFQSLRRVPGVKRSKILAQKHQAASIYVEAGIAYVNKFVKRMGSTPEIIEEGRARMEDLRDVARNYPELNKMLNNAINKLSPSNRPLSKQ